MASAPQPAKVVGGGAVVRIAYLSPRRARPMTDAEGVPARSRLHGRLDRALDAGRNAARCILALGLFLMVVHACAPPDPHAIPVAQAARTGGLESWSIVQ